jgi:glutathione S-transferase
MYPPDCSLFITDVATAWSLLQVRLSGVALKCLLTPCHSEVILDFAKEEHKTEEYRKLNPNGRIPTLVDHSNNDEVIWESNAILKYIAERFDTDRKLLDTNEKERADLDTCKPLKLPTRLPSHTFDRALLPSLPPGTHLR